MSFSLHHNTDEHIIFTRDRSLSLFFYGLLVAAAAAMAGGPLGVLYFQQSLSLALSLGGLGLVFAAGAMLHRLQMSVLPAKIVFEAAQARVNVFVRAQDDAPAAVIPFSEIETTSLRMRGRGRAMVALKRKNGALFDVAQCNRRGLGESLAQRLQAFVHDNQGAAELVATEPSYRKERTTAGENVLIWKDTVSNRALVWILVLFLGIASIVGGALLEFTSTAPYFWAPGIPFGAFLIYAGLALTFKERMLLIGRDELSFGRREKDGTLVAAGEITHEKIRNVAYSFDAYGGLPVLTVQAVEDGEEMRVPLAGLQPVDALALEREVAGSHL